jgi:hypothetical protein
VKVEFLHCWEELIEQSKGVGGVYLLIDCQSTFLLVTCFSWQPWPWSGCTVAPDATDYLKGRVRKYRLTLGSLREYLRKLSFCRCKEKRCDRYVGKHRIKVLKRWIVRTRTRSGNWKSRCRLNVSRCRQLHQRLSSFVEKLRQSGLTSRKASNPWDGYRSILSWQMRI